MSIEGGIRGDQQRLVCPNCKKVFFAWRPDDLPGQKIKCYFCRFEFADEAALRQPPAPIPAPPPAATPEPAAAGGEPAAAGGEAAPAAPEPPAPTPPPVDTPAPESSS